LKAQTDKKLLVTLVFVVEVGISSFAQTNFYTNVTNLWYQGYKTNVLEIAEQRLNVNSNDIAGLILKAEYHFAFLEVSAISNAYLRVLQVGDTVATTNFAKRFVIERQYITDILDDFTESPVTPDELLRDKPKANIIHKPLPTKLIEALQEDGYFD